MTLDRINSIAREDVVLVFLASVPAGFFGPVHVQKGVFLLSQKVPEIFDTPFEFRPQTFGPSCPALYDELEVLIGRKLVRVVQDAPYRFREYVALPDGLRRSQELAEALNKADLEYIQKTAAWVLERSFAELVASVARAYPEMGTEMIFRDKIDE